MTSDLTPGILSLLRAKGTNKKWIDVSSENIHLNKSQTHAQKFRSSPPDHPSTCSVAVWWLNVYIWQYFVQGQIIRTVRHLDLDYMLLSWQAFYFCYHWLLSCRLPDSLHYYSAQCVAWYGMYVIWKHSFDVTNSTRMKWLFILDFI